MTNEGDWRSTRSTMSEKMKFLLASGKFADATIAVQDQEFRVVSFLLKLYSPYFENAFDENNMFENGETKLIYYCDPRHFGSVLQFIYTEELDWTGDLLDAIYLLKIARQFKVEEMAKKVSKLLDSIVNGSVIPNAVSQYGICQILEESRSLELPEIEQLALAIISKHGHSIFSGNTYLSLTVGSLCRIIEQDDLEIANELALFNAVKRWAEQRLARPSSSKNLRIILKDVIPLIRFPNMSKQDFINHVYPSGLLESEQLLTMMDLILGKRRRSITENPFNGNPRLYYLPQNEGSLQTSSSTETLAISPPQNEGSVQTPSSTETLAISPPDDRIISGIEEDGQVEDEEEEEEEGIYQVRQRNVNDEIDDEVDEPEYHTFYPIYD